MKLKKKFEIKRPEAKQSKKYDGRFEIFMADQPIVMIQTGTAETYQEPKRYRVLSVGTFYSRIYNGLWDADPALYHCEKAVDKPIDGKVEVRLNFLEALALNFQKNANETVPFVDVDHDQGISAGPIVNVELEDGVLYVVPTWNEIGTDAIINKKYMYLSIGIERHKDSKTGMMIFPVMSTVSLTNIPVDKAQEILELSDKPAATADKAGEANRKEKIKGGPHMDELLQMITDFMAKAEAAIGADESGAIKAALGAAIDNMEVKLGLATEEEEAGEGATDEVAAAEKAAAAPAEGAAATTPAEGVKMSEREILMADKLAKMETSLKNTQTELKLKDFNSKFLNRKFTKANAGKWEGLFLKDEVATTAILTDLPDLGLLGEKGSDQDIKLAEIKDAKTARAAFDKAVQEIMASDKLDPDRAIDALKKKDPALYDLGMKTYIPGEQKKGA